MVRENMLAKDANY
jgi:hypothetical protein